MENVRHEAMRPSKCVQRSACSDSVYVYWVHKTLIEHKIHCPIQVLV